MSSHAARGRVSHAQRYAITATQFQLDFQATSQIRHRTGPRAGSRIAVTMAALTGANGHGDRRWRADRLIAIEDHRWHAALVQARDLIARVRRAG